MATTCLLERRDNQFKQLLSVTCNDNNCFTIVYETDKPPTTSCGTAVEWILMPQKVVPLVFPSRSPTPEKEEEEKTFKTWIAKFKNKKIQTINVDDEISDLTAFKENEKKDKKKEKIASFITLLNKLKEIYGNEIKIEYDQVSFNIFDSFPLRKEDTFQPQQFFTLFSDSLDKITAFENPEFSRFCFDQNLQELAKDKVANYLTNFVTNKVANCLQCVLIAHFRYFLFTYDKQLKKLITPSFLPFYKTINMNVKRFGDKYQCDKMLASFKHFFYELFDKVKENIPLKLVVPMEQFDTDLTKSGHFYDAVINYVSSLRLTTKDEWERLWKASGEKVGSIQEYLTESKKQLDALYQQVDELNSIREIETKLHEIITRRNEMKLNFSRIYGNTDFKLGSDNAEYLLEKLEKRIKEPEQRLKTICDRDISNLYEVVKDELNELPEKTNPFYYDSDNSYLKKCHVLIDALKKVIYKIANSVHKINSFQLNSCEWLKQNEPSVYYVLFFEIQLESLSPELNEFSELHNAVAALKASFERQIQLPRLKQVLTVAGMPSAATTLVDCLESLNRSEVFEKIRENCV